VPGHTLGAVSYCIEDAVFTGDTLFIAGCGRLFEGTPEQMHTSLSGKLGRLPRETRVYCGHEYTVSNLRFAVHAEPDNKAAATKLEEARAKRERSEPTVPSTIGDELSINPFLRCDAPSLRERFPGDSPAQVFAAVRKAKDDFR
jgi:hydroxyacylglutathione hydrolase